MPSKTHGHSITKERTPTYRSWQAMKKRCNDPNSQYYSDYGGRGIRVCERWTSFQNFLSDMGEKPSPRHSLDRYPNQDGHYEPGNCRWATPEQQANNKRNNRILEFDGRRQTMRQWANELGLPYTLIQSRLARGLTVEDAFTAVKGFDRGMIQFNGRKQSVHDWARELGVKTITIYARLDKGWPLDRVLVPIIKPVDTILEFRCRIQPLTAWAKELGIRPGTIHQRLRRGMSVDAALTTPLRRW